MLAAINQKVALVANFGPGQTGLATVGYALKNGDGSSFQARTTTGVSEIQAGTGLYKVEVAASVFTGYFDGYVVWDTGGGSPVYASEDLIVTDRLDATVSSRATQTSLDTVAGYIDTEVAAIKAKTDNLPSDPADESLIEAILAVIQARTDLIGTGLATLDAPVFTGGHIQLVHGDDYNNTDGRALEWTGSAWPNIVGATIKLALHADKTGTTTQFTGTTISATQARVELTAAQTAALEVDSYSYDLQATLASGRVVTLARDRAKVLQDYAT